MCVVTVKTNDLREGDGMTNVDWQRRILLLCYLHILQLLVTAGYWCERISIMPICAECDRDLPRSAFSKGQLKKKGPSERRCKECVNDLDYAYQRYCSEFEEGLRFGVGDRVECNLGECGWCTGTVIKLWYVEGCYDEPNPYQVLLDVGSLIYAPEDTSDYIKSSNEPPPECIICYDNDMSPENLIVRNCGCRGEDGGFVHIDCLTRSALVKVETIIRRGQLDYDLFTSCGTCKQPFSVGGPQFLALAKACYERFKDCEDEHPHWHSLSIRNLSKALRANKELDKACEILNKRTATIYERLGRMAIRGGSNNSNNRIALLEDELCDILLQLVSIDIDRGSNGACITAVLNQAQHLNEKMRAHDISCYVCRKCEILERFCSIAWDDGKLHQALAYAEEALSLMQEHDDDHEGLALSNYLFDCGCLKAATGERNEGIELIQKAVDIDTRLYGRRYHVTGSRINRLEMIQNGEEITERLMPRGRRCKIIRVPPFSTFYNLFCF